MIRQAHNQPLFQGPHAPALVKGFDNRAIRPGFRLRGQNLPGRYRAPSSPDSRLFIRIPKAHRKPGNPDSPIRFRVRQDELHGFQARHTNRLRFWKRNPCPSASASWGPGSGFRRFPSWQRKEGEAPSNPLMHFFSSGSHDSHSAQTIISRNSRSPFPRAHNPPRLSRKHPFQPGLPQAPPTAPRQAGRFYPRHLFHKVGRND